MIEWRSIIPAVFAALAVAGTVRADMAPAGRSRASIHEPLTVGGRADFQSANCLNRVLDLAGEVGFGSLSAEYLSKPGVEAGQSLGTQPVRLITDSRGSLSLFLCGLMSLGVLRSAAWMKKMSFGGLTPDWYHNGGPFQIGHSLAIGPDLHFAAVCCLVQPDRTGEDCLPQDYEGTIVSLWRKSQFTPTALASRGPPRLTN